MLIHAGDSVFDAVIIGAGPAGIAAALAIQERDGNARVALLDVGHSHHRRPCPVDNGRSCRGCGGICNVISGFGGCMHYGDGVKLSLFPSGRRLSDLFGEERSQKLSDRAFEALTSYLDNPPELRGYEIPAHMEVSFENRGLKIRPYPVATVGESSLEKVIDGFHADLSQVMDVLLNHDLVGVSKIDEETYRLHIKGRRGEISEIQTHALVVATGRRGLTSTQDILRSLNVKMDEPAPSIGVRFEMRSSLLEEVGLGHPDLKVSQRDQARKTKSFCFCGGSNGGRIKYTNYQTTFGVPLITLDGHETLDRIPVGERELAGNFGLMCQLQADGEAHEAKFQDRMFGKYREIADGRPIVQRLRTFTDRVDEPLDWSELSDSLPFVPSVADVKTGPVHELLNEAQHDAIVHGFRELIEPILEVAGEEADPDRLLDEVIVWGLEVEFLWNKVALSENAETSASNVFVVGDAAGYAQGIIQGMMMGYAAGDCVAARIAEKRLAESYS
ncbi:FAD-dependent oxidoreductase [Streptomyces sp. GZWMJZ-114]|uniref:FAD-dependent oxidoreductase n=1 Tax=Streptomyces sp. GZWMJZ-114 TaxID=2494734 RepID=UPI001010F5E1|nr:FAD-dependent oxidoreductase [Streptomyces sp. GZWMJZ-114]